MTSRCCDRNQQESKRVEDLLHGATIAVNRAANGSATDGMSKRSSSWTLREKICRRSSSATGSKISEASPHAS